VAAAAIMDTFTLEAVSANFEIVLLSGFVKVAVDLDAMQYQHLIDTGGSKAKIRWEEGDDEPKSAKVWKPTPTLAADADADDEEDIAEEVVSDVEIIGSDSVVW